MGDLALIVDPDEVERRYMAAVLAAEGLDITQVGSPIEGIVKAMEKNEDAAVIILAEETDPVPIYDVIRVIRRVTSTPLLVLGGESSSELDSLYHGADDYMARPFSASGLIAHVRLVTRRRGGPDVGTASLDTSRRSSGDPRPPLAAVQLRSMLRSAARNRGEQRAG